MNSRLSCLIIRCTCFYSSCVKMKVLNYINDGSTRKRFSRNRNWPLVVSKPNVLIEKPFIVSVNRLTRSDVEKSVVIDEMSIRRCTVEYVAECDECNSWFLRLPLTRGVAIEAQLFMSLLFASTTSASACSKFVYD